MGERVQYPGRAGGGTRSLPRHRSVPRRAARATDHFGVCLG